MRRAKRTAAVTIAGCRSTCCQPTRCACAQWFGAIPSCAVQAPLIGPTRRHVHQTRNAKAAWKGSVDCRLDDVRSKESEGKSHAGRSFADAFAGGDRLNAFDLAGNHFVEPSPPLGDGG